MPAGSAPLIPLGTCCAVSPHIRGGEDVQMVWTLGTEDWVDEGNMGPSVSALAKLH
jgi:hypothetical protein